jgi:opacity protein-like surface antigen
MRIKAILFLMALTLFSLPALAQDGNSEVSANFTGNFQRQASGEGLTDTPTYTGGILANYRYHFNRYSAIEVNYGYSRFSQLYNTQFYTLARTQELSLAYQFTFGVPKEARFHPFAEAGVGALFFSPLLSGSSGVAFTQNRAALLYGAGASYRLWRNVSAQVGFRGLVYTAPDFGVPNEITNARTMMAEPYAGFTFRF